MTSYTMVDPKTITKRVVFLLLLVVVVLGLCINQNKFLFKTFRRPTGVRVLMVMLYNY